MRRFPDEDVKPFSPDEARAAKHTAIPSFVLEAVNELLAESYTGSKITLMQSAIVQRIKDKMHLDGYDGEFINKWLDVEPIYEDNGWKVHYDKPGYNESFDAYFEFTPKTDKAQR